MAGFLGNSGTVESCGAKCTEIVSTQVESTQRSKISVYFGAVGTQFFGCPGESLLFGGRTFVLMRRRGVICL